MSGETGFSGDEAVRNVVTEYLSRFAKDPLSFQAETSGIYLSLVFQVIWRNLHSTPTPEAETIITAKPHHPHAAIFKL
jgi:hypothetical protein